MMSRKIIIYMATNKRNGKIYIGQTTQLLRYRIQRHEATSKKIGSRKFSNAIRKYTISGFDWEILAETTDKYANYYEIKYIAMYDSFKTGYNSTPGGNARGFKHTDTAKRKMSLARRNKKITQKHKDAILLTIRLRGPQSGKYKGVYFDKSRCKWMARIGYKNKEYNLGRFNTAEEAAQAYNNEAKRLYGDICYFNILTV